MKVDPGPKNLEDVSDPLERRLRRRTQDGSLTPEAEWFLHLNDCGYCTAIGSRCEEGDKMIRGKNYKV